MSEEVDCPVCDEDGQIYNNSQQHYETCPECKGSKKVPAPKDYEMIGCQEAGGRIEIDKALEHFSDRCAQSCPNWNLCSQLTNNA